MRWFRNLVSEVRKWTWHHFLAFIITFFLYALYHACRKAFSNIKNAMEKSLSPAHANMHPYDIWESRDMFSDTKSANVFLGELDFLFLMAYSIGMYISGVIGDRVNLRYMLGVGVIGSSVATFTFGYLSVPLHITNRWFFRCLFFINGLFQSTGWPALVAVVANWFKSSQGLIFGIWTTNSYVGNIIGTAIVASVIDYGYEYGMLLNSLLSFCGGIVVLLCLIPDPDKYDLRNKGVGNNEAEMKDRNPEENVSAKTDIDNTQQLISCTGKAIKFWEAFLIPGVVPFALAYACLKMVTYAFFFWLPTYLSQGLHWSDKSSDVLSNFFDVGGMMGSLIIGFLSDHFEYRSPIVAINLLISIGLVCLYQAYGYIYWLNLLLMVLIGIGLSGPACLICTVICTDLGRHEKINGSRKALATVSGIVDGTGSLGAALGQFLVGVISKYYGWKWVFKFLVIMVSMSFLLILPIVVNDIRSWRKKKSSNR